MRAHTLVFFAGLILALAGGQHELRGEPWLDPEPPVTWESILGSQVVVVGTYASHKNDTVTLKVVEVLRGGVERGELITVKLDHFYTLETCAVGWEYDRRSPKEDGIPKLCYKRPLFESGPVPAAVRRDARHPALYFFPDKERPALRVRGQVQSPHFWKGWKQALDGQPMDLLFRLTQHVSPELAREALEELGKTRDPASLDQLFAWNMDPAPEGVLPIFGPCSLLARLKDRNGDVYDRAARLLSSAAPGSNQYRFFPLGNLMAITDSRRALADLPQLLSPDHPLAVRQAAMSGLGRIPDRNAAQQALDSLRVDELAESAAWAVKLQLEGDDDYRFGKYRGLGDDKWLLAEIQSALNDERVADVAKKTLRDWIGRRLRSADPVSLERLRTNLLDPNDPLYHGQVDGETANMLQQAREACDPRVVPILAEVLDQVPASRGARGYVFQQALIHYAKICPRAMQKELEARLLPQRMSDVPFRVRDAFESAGIVGPEDSYLADEVEHAFELASGVRAGKLYQFDKLLTAADELYQKRGYAGLPALLECGRPEGKERFLAYVSKAKQGTIHRASNRRSLGQLTSILYYLHPRHNELLHALVLELLKSKMLVEREAGVGALRSTWKWDFDYDPAALEKERTARLAELEPLLRELELVPEPQARVILLESAGFPLMGEPHKDWLPALVDAAGSRGSAAPHALRVIEAIVGEPRCRHFESFPPDQRKRAVRAYLQDRGSLGQ